MRWIGRAFVLVFLTCAAAACSSSANAPAGLTPGTATLDSTFTSMPAHSWASAAVSTAGDAGVSLVVTNLAGGVDACLAASAGTSTASTVQLVVSMSSNQVRTPGKYNLGDEWQASYSLADAECAAADQGVAVQGTLEIDSVDMSVHGVADVTFPTGRIIATFAAPFCGAAPSGTACMTYPSCPAGHGADPTPPAEACLASP